MSKKEKDSSADSKANEKTELSQEEIVKGFCTEVNGRTLDSYSDEIKTSWAIGTKARLNVGRLLSIVVDNEMLKAVDLTFEGYVTQFGIKSSMGYLLMKVWKDSEVRGMVENGLPLQAADNIIGIGNKWGEKYRQQLVDYATGADDGAPTNNTRELREKAKKIRQEAHKAKNPPPPPPSDPPGMLQAVLSIQRALQQEKSALLGKVKEVDAKIAHNAGEIKRLEALVKTLADATEASAEINCTVSAGLLARANGIDLTTMKGSGPNGRIFLKDVKAEIASTKLDKLAEELTTD